MWELVFTECAGLHVVAGAASCLAHSEVAPLRGLWQRQHLLQMVTLRTSTPRPEPEVRLVQTHKHWQPICCGYVVAP